MVGSKPNAYLTEEARLEAQRRMLAERYGLLSDSDGNDSDGEATGASVDANGLSNGNGNGTANGQPNGQVPPDRSTAPPPAVADEPAPSEAATYGEGSSVHDADIATILSQEDAASTDANVTTIPEEKLAPPKRNGDGWAPGWPGVEILDPSARIHAEFEYSVAAQREAASSRDLRVTQVTKYASQFIEKHRRKIAVNDQIITYAVGGHIRALLRNTTVRSLLKGHDSAVVDIEFLGQEKLEPTTNDSISVLGSVAEDGSVYVWKIVRRDTDGEPGNLDVADSIRFEHPDIDQGRSYSRIAFRPGSGSIIADKGIGVAMILVDSESPDVRLVELVKMNEKMMVRDKFLRAAKELDDDNDKDVKTPVDSAAWLSERMAATSRRGKVFLWNTDGTLAHCIAMLPRDKTTKVTALHALNQEALLLEVESGRELEVWVAAGFAPDVDSASLELRQTIKIQVSEPTEMFAVSSVDPMEELVVISNAKGNSVFVLHFNRHAQAFDAITEVPVQQPVLSFCMTRNVVRTSQAGAMGTPVVNLETADHVGLWCVQPKGIALIHLPAPDCAPKRVVKSEVFPKSTQKSVMRKMERPPPSVSLSSSGTSTITSGTSASAPQGVPRSSSYSGRSLPPVSASLSIRNNKPAVTASGGHAGAVSSTDSSKKPVTGSSGAVTPTQSSHMRSPSPPSEPTPSADEMADSVIAAAKRAVEAFEHSAAQRNNTERAKMDRLVESVAQSARANLERFVNSSMKKVLADVMIPKMSKMIADMRAATMKNSRVDLKVSTEIFEAALEKANVTGAFANACQEMERQVGASVTQSMTAKYDALIGPAISGVNDASEDLGSSLKVLRSKMEDARASEGEPAVVEIGEEDIRTTIDEEIGRGNTDGAFQTALDKEDLNLVTWLCSKFETSTFFESNTLSQISLLSLAQQLGHGLGDGDVVPKVEWLREIMLVLEPESEEIEMISQPAVKELVENVGELRKNKELLDEHDGLEKNLKTLSRLIWSHVPN